MKNNIRMNYKHIHFIGIGGIGMSGIAFILQNRGKTISGSDIKQSHILDLLREQGVKVFLGHNPENVWGADLVVCSSAIKSDNVEILEAKKQNIPVIKRAECLAGLMKDKISIAISGSHGKTTTTSLVSYMLTRADFEPTAIIGGIVRNWDNNIYLGKSNYFVAEADESDGTFLQYNPTYSIITNIDYEHLDYYKDYSAIIKAFGAFIDKTRKQGCVIGCGDDINIIKILTKYKKRYITFGLNRNCDIRAGEFIQDGFVSQFNCFYHGKLIGKFRLNLAGPHNVSNALSVIALGLELGIDKKIIYRSLSSFQGTERRFQIKAKSDRYLIIDDYAHHPTEIKATLTAARCLLDNNRAQSNFAKHRQVPPEMSFSLIDKVGSLRAQGKKYRRIIAVFQPHRYSRTKLLLDEFVDSFRQADYLIITDIYTAHEAPIQGITAKTLYDKIRDTGRKNIEYLAKDKIVNRILDIAASKDLIITLGAGDIGKLTDELSYRLVGKS